MRDRSRAEHLAINAKTVVSVTKNARRGPRDHAFGGAQAPALAGRKRSQAQKMNHVHEIAVRDAARTLRYGSPFGDRGVGFHRLAIAPGTHTSVRVGGTRGRNVMHLVTYLRSFVRRDEGQDLLEYALLVALIALVCVGAITLAGTNVSTIFTNIANAL